MDEETEKTIKAFVKERDEVLLTGEVEKVRAFFLKHNGHSLPSAVAEVSMHKAITGSLGLPREYRLKSKKWLERQGFSSLDGGTLADA